MVVVLVINVIFIFTEAGIRRSYDMAIVSEKWQHILNPISSTPDFLILGDSSGLYGVSPSVLDSVLGTHSWNFCTFRPMTTIAHATMLHKFIEQHGVPKGILLVQVYDSWYKRLNPQYLSQSSIYRDTWEQFGDRGVFSLREKVSVTIGRILPITENRTRLAAFLKFPWHKVKIHFSKGAQFRSTRRNLRGIRQIISDHLTHRIPSILEIPSPISKPHRIALEYVARLAIKHDFPVYIANGPIVEAVASQPEFVKAFARVDSALAGLTKDYPKVHYINLLSRHPMKDMLNTPDHLLPHAADRYTSRLAKAIRMMRTRNQTRSHD
jgi:hypothetical protein